MGRSSKLNDLTGQRFNRLTVLYRGENTKSGGIRWVCQCDCGKVLTISASNLTFRNQISCGCYATEVRKSLSGKNSANKKYNQYDLSGEYGIGWTNNTNQEFYFDIEDYHKIKDYCWYEDTRGYIKSIDYTHQKPYIYLHRLVMDLLDENLIVDHIHHKLYDNRKSELRIATIQNNNMNHRIAKNNTSGVTGVSYNKQLKKYIARIRINKKDIHLGCYSDFEEAVKARKEAEQKYFGEYAYEPT